jgi:hypothetical protein
MPSVAVAQNFREKACMKDSLREADLPFAHHWLAHNESGTPSPATCPHPWK